ncbi:MAG: hypothetical protein ACRECO_00770 [Xanthobacteraceae bacterium]
MPMALCFGEAPLRRPIGDQLAWLLRVLRGLARRRGRQLQHGSDLARPQPRYQHDLPVREFQRVMMRVGILKIDLPEAGEPMADLAARKHAEGRLAFDVSFEGKFGARPQAHGDIGFADGGEAARDGISELGRYQGVFEDSGSRGDVM